MTLAARKNNKSIKNIKFLNKDIAKNKLQRILINYKFLLNIYKTISKTGGI